MSIIKKTQLRKVLQPYIRAMETFMITKFSTTPETKKRMWLWLILRIVYIKRVSPSFMESIITLEANQFAGRCIENHAQGCRRLVLASKIGIQKGAPHGCYVPHGTGPVSYTHLRAH